MTHSSSRRDVIRVGAALFGASVLGCHTREFVECADAEPSERARVLAGLMSCCRTTDAEFRGGLANHLPMALCAHFALGASAAQLRALFDHSFPALDPFPSSADADDGRAWFDRLGERKSLPILVKHFEADLALRSRDEVLRDALSRLVPALSAYAFHGLIRTAYAVRFEHDAELAHGLGFWASRAVPLAPLESGTGNESDPAALASAVRASPDLARRPIASGSVLAHIQDAASRPGFSDLVGALRIDDDTHARLVNFAARAYLAQGNLTTLHGITGAHAFRVLEPYFENREAALRYLWQALAAVYIGTGAPEIADLSTIEPPSWDDIREHALASSDHHHIKLADSAFEEERVFAGKLHRYAAAKRLGLV